MSGQVANSFFFIKKKDWRSKTLANPPPPMSDSISFLVYHSPTPPHPSSLKVDVICVSPLNFFTKNINSFADLVASAVAMQHSHSTIFLL